MSESLLLLSKEIEPCFRGDYYNDSFISMRHFISRKVSALTKKKAKKTAMKEAGAKTVSKLKIKKSKYRGVRIWEIEFRADGNDYEYKIGLYTGRILEKERELNDKKY